MSATSRKPDGRGRFSLALPLLVCLVLLFGGLAVGIVLGGVMPPPYGPATAVVAYVRAEPVAVQVIAGCVFAASVPLAIYAAAAAARLRQLGALPPVAMTALVGGTLAAAALGLTGLLAWTLSRPEVSADPALVRAIYYLVFLIGGPGHLAALGLQVGGIAVASLTTRLLAHPLAWLGLAIAALAELTTLVLAWPDLGVILPIARVAALVWLVAAAALLPRVHLDAV